MDKINIKKDYITGKFKISRKIDCLYNNYNPIEFYTMLFDKIELINNDYPDVSLIFKMVDNDGNNITSSKFAFFTFHKETKLEIGSIVFESYDRIYSGYIENIISTFVHKRNIQ
jgi:hypothetical protein